MEAACPPAGHQCRSLLLKRSLWSLRLRYIITSTPSPTHSCLLHLSLFCLAAGLDHHFIYAWKATSTCSAGPYSSLSYYVVTVATYIRSLLCFPVLVLEPPLAQNNNPVVRLLLYSHHCQLCDCLAPSAPYHHPPLAFQSTARSSTWTMTLSRQQGKGRLRVKTNR